MASTPRAAALRLAPRRAARIAATVNHSRLWFATVETAFMAVSSGLGGSAAIVRDTARSASTASSVTRRIHGSTARHYAHGPYGTAGGRTRHGQSVTGVTRPGSLRLRLLDAAADLRRRDR